MKKKSTTVIFIMTFLAGLSLLLYPTVGSYWNSLHATEAVTAYRETANSLTEEQDSEMLAAADVYNAELSEGEQDYFLTEEERGQYGSLLDPDGSGMMGYVEIPAIDVELPIYHGTDEAVLQTSVGHLEWTSLPVGGKGTHSVLSGHRGLPSARLFTDLDKLSVGDTFTVTVLNRTVTYEVDRIETVLPEQAEDLRVEDGQDLCTLLTCTPYGINTHRLLVRGHRIENAKQSAHINAEAVQIAPLMVMPFAALPMLITAFVIIGFLDKRKERDEGDISDENDTE